MPELTAILKSATNLINSELGGIGGHTMELVTCEITDPESGQSCGQQFANDDSIVVIGQGNITLGTEAFHAAVDPVGIPIVGALPLAPQDGMSRNSFYTGPGSFTSVPSFTQLANQYSTGDNVSIITIEGNPVSSMVGGQLAEVLTRTGKTVTTAPLALGATDATASLVAAGVNEADIIIPFTIEPAQCVAVANALDALGTDATVLALNTCASEGVLDALGDFPTWTYLWTYANTEVEPEDELTKAQLDAYTEWVEALDEPLDSVIQLQTALTIQRHLIAGGAADATRESVIEAARSWTGPIYLGSPEVAYGSVQTFAPMPALPNVQSRAYTYEGNGVFIDVTDGAWIG